MGEEKEAWEMFSGLKVSSDNMGYRLKRLRLVTEDPKIRERDIAAIL